MLAGQRIADNVRAAVELLLDALATGSLQSREPIKRIYRDPTTIRTDYCFDVDGCSDHWRATLLGLEDYRLSDPLDVRRIANAKIHPHPRPA